MGNTHTPNQIVAANIRAEMGRHRITQSTVAAHLGISQPSVSARLSGRTSIDVDDLFAISELIGVAPADLLTPAAASSPGAAGGSALPGG